MQWSYCWWTKSCTTKDDNYPINYRVLTIPGGCLEFRPSTVWTAFYRSFTDQSYLCGPLPVGEANAHRHHVFGQRGWGIQSPHLRYPKIYMDVSENSGTPESSILIGVSIINHPFWGTPILWKHPHVGEVLPILWCNYLETNPHQATTHKPSITLIYLFICYHHIIHHTQSPLETIPTIPTSVLRPGPADVLTSSSQANALPPAATPPTEPPAENGATRPPRQ